MSRLRAVPVSLSLWQSMMTEGNVVEGKLVTTRGLPEGAELVKSVYDETRSTVVLIFYHASFDDVPTGCGWHRIPEVVVEFRKDYPGDTPDVLATT